VLAVLAACAMPAASAAPTAAADGSRRVFAAKAAADLSAQVSSNWSGYAVTAPGTSFTDVTGTWVQPKAKCSQGRSSSSAFWVGLGGFDESSQALEQIGTEADCSASGKPTYGAWFEIVPAASVPVKLKVLPGDTMTAAVLVSGRQVTLGLKNLTRHTRFTKKLTVTGALDLSSAEWIAEAPSLCTASGRCRVTPLTNFGTVSFTRSSAIGDGHPATITDPGWAATPMELAEVGPSTGSFGRISNASGALPSGLSPDGRSFSVSWQANLAATSSG
jgi:Peptidase A4 family